MEEAYINRANELEAEGVVPYTIQPSDGLFCSTRKYPFFTLEVPEDNRVPCGGETLLSLYCSPGGSFKVVFPELTLESVDGKVQMFQGGLPLIGQCNPPKIVRDKPETKVYAVYEFYGPIKRRELYHYRFKDDTGVLVRTTCLGQFGYRAGGVNDIGHSHNTLYRLKDDFTPFQRFMANILTQHIDVAMQFLDDPQFDYTQYDRQLFRELHCGRLTTPDTLRIYKKLAEKHNYSMTEKDFTQLIHHSQTA